MAHTHVSRSRRRTRRRSPKLRKTKRSIVRTPPVKSIRLRSQEINDFLSLESKMMTPYLRKIKTPTKASRIRRRPSTDLRVLKLDSSWNRNRRKRSPNFREIKVALNLESEMLRPYLQKYKAPTKATRISRSRSRELRVVKFDPNIRFKTMYDEIRKDIESVTACIRRIEQTPSVQLLDDLQKKVDSNLMHYRVHLGRLFQQKDVYKLSPKKWKERFDSARNSLPKFLQKGQKHSNFGLNVTKEIPHHLYILSKDLFEAKKMLQTLGERYAKGGRIEDLHVLRAKERFCEMLDKKLAIILEEVHMVSGLGLGFIVTKTPAKGIFVTMEFQKTRNKSYVAVDNALDCARLLDTSGHSALNEIELYREFPNSYPQTRARMHLISKSGKKLFSNVRGFREELVNFKGLAGKGGPIIMHPALPMGLLGVGKITRGNIKQEKRVAFIKKIIKLVEDFKVFVTNDKNFMRTPESRKKYIKKLLEFGLPIKEELLDLSGKVGGSVLTPYVGAWWKVAFNDKYFTKRVTPLLEFMELAIRDSESQSQENSVSKSNSRDSLSQSADIQAVLWRNDRNTKKMDSACRIVRRRSPRRSSFTRQRNATSRRRSPIRMRRRDRLSRSRLRFADGAIGTLLAGQFMDGSFGSINVFSSSGRRNRSSSRSKSKSFLDYFLN